MPPKKKGKKSKKAAAPELTEEEKQHLLLVQECRRLKQLKLAEEAKFNEFQQEKVRLCFFSVCGASLTLHRMSGETQLLLDRREEEA